MAKKACPGGKIRSDGKGRGLGKGQGQGPVGEPRYSSEKYERYRKLMKAGPEE